MSNLSPLERSVVDGIVSRIRSGELPAGRRLPSERQIAEMFGVSRIVVRAALKELVLDGYVVSKPRCQPVVAPEVGRPRSFTASGPRTIAIWVWPSRSDYCAATVLQGIQRVGLEPDMRLVVGNAIGNDWDSQLDSERRFLESLATDPWIAGAIIWYLGGEKNRDALLEVRDSGIPIVLVDRLGPSGFDSDFVGTDNEAAAKRSVRHLIDLGHKRIALISNSERASCVLDRELGYERALREAGIDYNPAYVIRDKPNESDQFKSDLTNLLSLDNRPTAMFCVSDHIALVAWEELSRKGLSVPADMSLVGFDGLLQWIPGGGHLTSAKQEFERIGEAAAELLVKRILEGPPGTYRHVFLDAPLILQGSTARPGETNELYGMPVVGNSMIVGSWR